MAERIGYSARTLLDIEVEFDTSEARRFTEFGDTLYLPGGQIVQYAGGAPIESNTRQPLPEVGFHISPWSATISQTGTGNVEIGTYAMRSNWLWDNAAGERERSTSAAVGQVTMSADGFISFEAIPSPQATNKANIAGEHWRTLKNPPIRAPFYRTTDNDPGNTGLAKNQYVLADVTAQHSPSTYDDDLSDATLAGRETNPENYGVLENIAPPAATIILNNYDRVFLAGIAALPYTVAYSKYRKSGHVASFHDGLAVNVPATTGVITALRFLNETLVVFCERGIYMLPGDGLNDVGAGLNYGPAQQIATDIGAVNQDTTCVTTHGIVFESDKGWHLLTRGWEVQYIGGEISDYDSDTWLSAHMLHDRHELRLLSTSRLLVYNFKAEQWSEWEISNAIAPAVIWQDQWVYLASDGNVYTEAADYSTCNYSFEIETPWLRFDQLMGRQKVLWMEPLGEYKSSHRVRVRAAYNNVETASGPTWTDDKHWTVSPTTVNGPLEFRHGFRYPNCSSVKVNITDRHASTATPPAGESFELVGLTFMVGLFPQKRPWHGLPAAQKQ